MWKIAWRVFEYATETLFIIAVVLFMWHSADRIERLERTQIHLCNLPGVICAELNGKVRP